MNGEWYSHGNGYMNSQGKVGGKSNKNRDGNIHNNSDFNFNDDGDETSQRNGIWIFHEDGELLEKEFPFTCRWE